MIDQISVTIPILGAV